MEKGKARGALEKGEGEGIPAKGIAKEMQKGNQMKAKYLASFGVLEMDTASLGIIAGTVIVERKEGREKGVLRCFYQARKRKPRRRW